MIYEIKSLAFSYRQDRPVLRDISFTLEQGEMIVLLGRNGAGKSTLLRLMLGLEKPQAGEISLLGKPLASLGEQEIAQAVGYVPQTHIPSFSYSVLEFVVMGCASRVKLFAQPSKAEYIDAMAALEELGVGHLAQRPYTELSGGERQQATIARAIVARPQVVLFDEPTAHLDFGNQLRVLRIIRDLSQRGYAVILTTHNPDHALLLGGKTALMDGHGGLIAGETQQLLTAARLSAVYGTDVHLEYLASLDRTVCIYPGL